MPEKASLAKYKRFKNRIHGNKGFWHSWYQTETAAIKKELKENGVKFKD